MDQNGFYVFLRLHFSIPDADFTRHPAHLTGSAAKGHQGIVDYCSLYAISESHVSPHGCWASWQTTQTAVFSILMSSVAAQGKWTAATNSTD